MKMLNQSTSFPCIIDMFLRSYLSFLVILLSPLIIHSQVTVNGTVTDLENEPLIGVNVQIKGSNSGTATDFDGQFELSGVNANDVLVFSYIGYQTQEVLVDGKTTINVTLNSDAEMLDEVVVTALGIGRMKKTIGFTTQEVGTEQLANSKTMNLGTALSGQVAGLTVTNPTGMFQGPQFVLPGEKPVDSD